MPGSLLSIYLISHRFQNSDKMSKRPIYFIVILGAFAVLLLWNPFNIRIPETPKYSGEDSILVAAHRGSHKKHPENSLAAIQQSIDTGIDIVEIDVRETRDKQLILMHDETLDRTTTGSGNVMDTNWSEIAELNLLFDGRSSREKIPKLEEALKMAKGKITVNLDFKTEEAVLIKRVYQLISDYNMEDSVILTIDDLKLIPELHNYNPNIKLMPVVFSKRKIRQMLKYEYIKILQVYPGKLTNALQKDIEDREILIWMNSLRKYDKLEASEKSGFEKLISKNKVDMIQTDHPEELRDFLKARNLHH
jgi:glycerophosphoryl diester phosphodiesterase